VPPVLHVRSCLSCRRWFFPICNQPASNGVFIATHQSHEDGGFDEDDVMVPVSLPVVVVPAYPQQPALRRPDTTAPRGCNGN
jgi:hypothetical protein